MAYEGWNLIFQPYNEQNAETDRMRKGVMAFDLWVLTFMVKKKTEGYKFETLPSLIGVTEILTSSLI